MRKGTGPGPSAPCPGDGRPWEAVRAEVTGWPGVAVLSRFGRDGLCLRGRLFACGPGAGDDLWVRLTLPLQRLALRETGILPHPRFARTGWIVLRLRGASGRSLARRWLARAYAAARGVPPGKP
ncbi:MAG TPA: luciferase family protein [Candidatus Methylomirabilis sp.]|nr:luciferase family protein [Candidatus Methylomirabilis sp.]